jgi:hypothetical protein
MLCEKFAGLSFQVLFQNQKVDKLADIQGFEEFNSVNLAVLGVG